MTESLLSFSEVLLFGRVVDDIAYVPETEFEADAATTTVPADLKGEKTIDGINIVEGDHVLVASNNKDDFDVNGNYLVGDDADKTWILTRLPIGSIVNVKGGNNNKGYWRQTKSKADKQKFKKLSKKKRPGLGNNKHLAGQLDEEANFARIYGFAFEGTYYELPEPTVFMVHGDGDSAAANSGPRARSPLDPSDSGVASADYQVSDDIRVWNYDKADYTVRMDVMTGMVEQVLLDIYFGFDSPAISGAKVSGAKVSGAKVSGAKVSGAKVSGAKVSGAKARGSD